jgi:hypothetical protein
MPTTAASSAPAGPSRNKRPAHPQRSVPPPPSKKQAVVTKIPKTTKLSYEKTDEELNASVKAEVKAFFEKTKADVRAKQEKPYLMYPRVKLRQVVQSMQDEKCAASKKPVPSLSDFERTIKKKIKGDKRKEKAVGRDVA